jgi:hypothetical protein
MDKHAPFCLIKRKFVNEPKHYVSILRQIHYRRTSKATESQRRSKEGIDMRKVILFLLALTLLFSLPITAAAASNLTTEQKYDVLKQKGIFSGFSDGSSRLYQSMTREQFAQVLFKLFELPETQGSPSYLDVIKTRWSYTPVEAVTKAGLMLGVGNREFDPASPVTVEQLAAILVRGFQFSGDGGYVVGKASKWARASVGIALQRGLIPQMSDYTVPATRGLLVEATYAVYDQTNQDPLRVKSVEPISNQMVRVKLSQVTSTADKDHFTLKDILGVTVNIQQSILSPDGLSITVVTDRQVANRTHTLYVDGVPWTYIAPSDDTSKPTVVSLTRQLNSVIEVVFSEPVDRGTATDASNFWFNNDLKLTSIQLSDDNRKVTMTTSKQNDGTTYRLSIRNVKDLAGNRMDDWNGTFYVDSSIPRASFDFDVPTARLKLTFSEKINPGQATNIGQYSIDKGISVVRADLAGDGKTVILTTSRQNDGTVYTLTVGGIRDLAGNTMNTQTFAFVGVSDPGPNVQLQSIVAVNQDTLEVTFNRGLSDADVSRLRVTVLTDNNNGYSMSGWLSFNMRKSGTDRAVLIQYRNRDPHPQLFLSGHAYLARVTGVANLITANNADLQSFAGTNVINLDPYVTQVIALSKNTVKIVFSEPVKNVSEKPFRVREKDGDYITILDDTLGNPNAVVTDVTLVLKDSFEKDHLYVMSFLPGFITDAAGWNGLSIPQGPSSEVIFPGV